MRLGIALAFAVTVVALVVRMVPVTSESFHYDAIVSQMAAQDGVRANAWDHDSTYSDRRYHPPLVSYLIIANNRVFGDGLFRARIFAMLFGALACGLTTLAALRLVPGLRAGWVWASLGGLTLAFVPVHLYISRTANWDPVYSAMAMACLLACSAFVRTPGWLGAMIVATLAALAFLTCEIALALVPALLWVVAWDVGQRGLGALRRWAVASLVGVGVVALLWPAGIIDGDIFRTLRFRWFDSATTPRNQPWMAFYSELFRQSPGMMSFAAVGTVGLVLARWRKVKLPWAELFPYVVYAATAIILSTRQRLVFVHHVADLIPPLLVVGTVGWAAAMSRTTTNTRLGTGIVGLGVGLTLLASLTAPAEIVGPQEHPGWFRLGEYFADKSGATVYTHYETQLRYYTDADIVVNRSPDRLWETDNLQTAQASGADYIAVDRSQLGGEVSSLEELRQGLAPRYRLVFTADHRRSGESVAWVFRRVDT